MSHRSRICAVLAARSAILLAALAAGDAAGVDSREVSFDSSGYRLVGTLTRPQDRAVVAGILIVPGSGPVDRDGTSRIVPAIPPIYRQWAERLAAEGFAVLRYDKRFLTHPRIDIASFDQQAQIADAASALSYLRASPELAVKRIFIIGHSEGGTLAPIVAARVGAIAGIAIVNTVQFAVDELLVAQLQAQPNVPAATVAEVKQLFAKLKQGSFPKDGLLLGAGADYWAQWIGYSRDSPATLSRLSMPILLVQCLNDETLPGEALARNVALLRAIASANRSVRLSELAGHDHHGMLPGGREAAPQFMHTLIDWLRAMVE